MSDWRELASRETDGLAVSLLWSCVTDRVKVVLADTTANRWVEFAVAPDRALDAFQHPFLYAGPEARVTAWARVDEVAV